MIMRVLLLITPMTVTVNYCKIITHNLLEIVPYVL